MPPRGRTNKTMTTYNIVIFGETGAGKSSLVNLIIGQSVAKVSPDVTECTTEIDNYTYTTGSVEYNLWDTPGLKEPRSELDHQAPAMTEAYRLRRLLHDRGGANLLVHCISGVKDIQIPSAPPSALQSHYRLFHDIFFADVPTVIVITHLDSRQRREEWWARNEEMLRRIEVSFAGHACVTALPRNSTPNATELEKSAEDARALLVHCSQNSYWKLGAVWKRLGLSKEVARSMASVVLSKWNATSISGYIMASKLVACCGLEEDEALELARRMRAARQLQLHPGMTAQSAPTSIDI
ncbi:P-loop containing nucleoside triphosphate hydrolase protein [Pisolithus croceorrhizus]|nr:P-loop containing nucleoside triphosphate hydrolase protein [Pisolithus croceorrhizus]